MGRISVSVRDLIDDYNGALNKYGQGAATLANEARKQWCQLRSQFPGWMEKFPGMGFSAGFHDQICKDQPDRPSPTPDTPFFTKRRRDSSGIGNCPGQTYEVRIRSWRHVTALDATTYRFDGPEGQGPIQSIELFDHGLDDHLGSDRLRQAWRVRFADKTESEDRGGFSTNLPSPNKYWMDYEISEDECTEGGDEPDLPELPPPPPYWPKPDGEPYGGGPDLPELPNFPPIELPSPPDFPDIPKPEINITFNVDNRKMEGPDFDIDIGGPNVNINWDDRRPPPILFPDPGARFPVPAPPPGPIIRPPAGGPGLPALPWGEIIGEIIGEVIPGGGSWVDYINLISNLINNLQDLQPGEDGVSVEEINVPFFDCDADEFKSLVWKIKKGDATQEELDLLSKHAQYVSRYCLDPCLTAAVPEWWAVRPGSDRPQLITTFRYAGSRTYGTLVIPHPSSLPDVGTSPIGEYYAGDWMARETLTDNSKVVCNALTESEAGRVLDEMIGWVNGGMRFSPPRRTIALRQGEGINQVKRIPRKVELFSQGRANNARPSQVWRVEPESDN